MRDIEAVTNTHTISGIHWTKLGKGEGQAEIYTIAPFKDTIPVTVPERVRDQGIKDEDFPLKVKVKTISVLRNYEWERENILIEVEKC
jgi:hypothetical protein